MHWKIPRVAEKSTVTNLLSPPLFVNFSSLTRLAWLLLHDAEERMERKSRLAIREALEIWAMEEVHDLS
jgi:hypothetical protein